MEKISVPWCFTQFIHKTACRQFYQYIFPFCLPISILVPGQKLKQYSFSCILSVSFYYFCLRANTTFHFPTRFEMSLSSLAHTPLSNNENACDLKFQLSMESFIKSKYQKVFMNSIGTSKTHTPLPRSTSAGLLKERCISLSLVAIQINQTNLVHFA